VRLVLKASVFALALVCASCGGTSVTVTSTEGSTAQATSPDPSRATAVVTAAEATFTIPIGTRPVWQWNLRSTPQGHREYQWEVGDVAERAYGFSLFRAPGAAPGQGNLAQLLAAGQNSVWEGTRDGGGRHVGTVRVRPTSGSSAVEIVVVEKEAIDKLWAMRPQTVQVVTRTPDLGDHKYSIPVIFTGR
jgi:hypothetical protein